MTLAEFNHARRRLNLLSSTFLLVTLLMLLLARIYNLRLVDEFRCPKCGASPIEPNPTEGEPSLRAFDPSVSDCVHCGYRLDGKALAEADAAS